MKLSAATLFLLPLAARAVMPAAEPLVEESGGLRGLANPSELAPVQAPSGGNGNGGAPPANVGSDGKATYIVTFSDDDGDQNEKAQGLAKKFDGSVKGVYKKVLNGAALRIPAGQANALLKSAGVESVEADQEFLSTALSQRYTWGQDRIDQCGTVGGAAITFEKMDASDVKVYIIDSGIDPDHDDFATSNLVSASCSKSYVSGNKADGNGHGTHVASTVCGEKYGVVTCGTGMLCAIQVMNSRGSGQTSDIISGIEDSVADCALVPGQKCVGNMSLGGGYSSAFNQAVDNAVQAGFTMVVAAGNSDANACDYSPASTQSAITVGATDVNDDMASFSNYGSCVDVYGPGVDIEAASSGTTAGTRIYSGTSMASPHIAGLAAALLQATPGLTPAQVDAELKSSLTMKGVDCSIAESGIATLGSVGDCSASTTDCTEPPEPPQGCAPCKTTISSCDQACCNAYGDNVFSPGQNGPNCKCSSC